MFFNKPKIYKSDGEMAAININAMRKEKGIDTVSFLNQAEYLVVDTLQRMGIFEKLSNNQYKQICQLSIRFFEGNIDYDNNRERISVLRDEILKDFK